MSTTSAVIISEYYLDELDSRKVSINRFLEQIDECEQLLKEIPCFNSFSHLAEKTEKHLRELHEARQLFLADIERLSRLESKLSEKDHPVGNTGITTAIDNEMQEIWEEELNIDTNFLQARTCCRKFLYKVVVSPYRKAGQGENSKGFVKRLAQKEKERAYSL